MQSFIETLRLARKDFFKLRRHRAAPPWALWLITLAVALGWGFGLLALAVAFGRQWPSATWWVELALPFIGTALLIGATFHIVNTAIERHAPDRFLAWVNGEPGLLVSLFYVASSMLCVAIGLTLSYLILGHVPGMTGADLTPQRSWLSIAVTSVVVSVIWAFWSWQEWHEEQLKRQAQEAQLRLLQAQIEPHFLFNTLANVQSLMDHDVAKAKRMLESFTDYLRTSLSSLRQEESTLSQELELARNYLNLLQTRMEDRLHFSIEADDASRAQPLPPLLLQPLVENAVVHGLEPSIEGGTVRLRAAVRGHQLVLEVQDDGRGPDAPPSRRSGSQPGAGMALANIRERLSARYGSAARLEVSAAHPGTLARITLPLHGGAA